MKLEKVSINLSFPHPVYGTFTPVKMEYEYSLQDGDDEHDALDAGKASAEEWFRSRYPDPEGRVTTPKADTATSAPETTVVKVKKKAPADRIAALVADIESCAEIKVLESYKLMVKKDKTLQAAYDKKMEELK